MIAQQWSRLLNRDDVLILDTETTGLRGAIEIVEIGIINTQGTELLHRYSLPQDPIEPAAVATHGLSHSALTQRNARPWPQIHAEVSRLLSQAKQVVIYNAEFDLRALRATARRHNLSLPRLKSHCAMKAYARHRNEPHPRFNDPRWHKLEDAARYEQIPASQQHRAIDDCQMVLSLMRAVAARRRAVAAGTRSPRRGSRRRWW